MKANTTSSHRREKRNPGRRSGSWGPGWTGRSRPAPPPLPLPAWPDRDTGMWAEGHTRPLGLCSRRRVVGAEAASGATARVPVSGHSRAGGAASPRGLRAMTATLRETYGLPEGQRPVRRATLSVPSEPAGGPDSLRANVLCFRTVGSDVFLLFISL